ncbi:MAG: hypothetical protein ACQEVA_00830 [Myxococcota bacterium]
MDSIHTPYRRPGSALCRAVVVLVLLGGVLAGCDPSGDGRCEPACNSGEVCNRVTGECVPVRLKRYEGKAPGRGLAMTATGGRIFLGAIEPRNGYLLVGSLSDGQPRMYILRQFQQVGDRSLAMDSTDDRVVVGWLAEDGRYRLATHRLDGEPDRWSTVQIQGASNLDYVGTHDFDVTLDNSGVIHLAFRDERTDTLRHISIDTEAQWSLQDIDTRADEGDEQASCPDGTALDAREGLGVDPDLVVRGSDLLVGYHDRACGDLRLARRLEDDWAVSTVDQGTAGDPMGSTANITGRHPSLAVDSSGRLAMVYRDVSGSRLIFAFQRNGEFEFQIADRGSELGDFSQRRKHLVGQFATLTFDERDRPRAAYLDATDATLKVAHRSESLDEDASFGQQTIDADSPNGFSSRIVFDPSVGLVAGSETLSPTPDGLASGLQIIEDGDLP